MSSMRIIIFSWEYPPRIVGKLAEYVKSLSTQLTKNHVDVHVVTFDDVTGQEHDASGVEIIRVANPVKTHPGVLTWVLTLNQEIERAAANIYYNNQKQVDLIDVFDWHFIPAAVTLKKAFGIPIVYSAESLEDQRSPNANSSYNMAIKSIEWLGLFEAKKISVKSEWMKEEIVNIYKVPPEKISVIPENSNSHIRENLRLFRCVSEVKKN
jgi:glycogen synthase